MFTPLRSRPERWLFTALVAVMLAPIVSQALDRPLSSLLGEAPGGAPITAAAIAIALCGWLFGAAKGGVRLAVSVALALLMALGIGLASGVTSSGAIALGTASLTVLALVRWLPPRLPPALDGLFGRHRALTLVYVAAALLSIVQVGRVSVFMADPTRTDAQVVPGLEFLEHHSCLTAYVRGGELAKDRVDNLYLADRWPSTVDLEVRPETPFSPFDVDAFFYPPPFLLLAELLAPLRGDFLAQRAAWFGLNSLLLAFGLWIGARAFGGSRWHRPLLLAPLFFASLPVLTILQVGQAQAAVVIAAVLGMLALEVGRPAIGGFALALATASKVSPGIFGVVLLVQRRWRAVAWTAACGLLLLLLAWIAYGSDPLISWITYALPRLGSGEAFAEMLNHPESAALNLSPSGTPYKLALLGLELSDPWSIARGVNTIFTLLVIALAVIGAHRHRSDRGASLTSRALGWMALLFLTALRSPFAPAYVAFAFLWALTILSVEVKTRRVAAGLVCLFVAATILPPISLVGQMLFVSFVEVITIGMAIWLVARRPVADGGE